jgi:uncharacterized membrane protein YkvI
MDQNAELLFTLANLTAACGWLILLFAPKLKRFLGIPSYWVPALLAVLYLILVLLHLGESEGSFQTLSGVAGLFANPWVLLAGWIHYLAFDLFVGSWEVRDAQARGLAHWRVLPCLLLTFLLGPIGLLLYLAQRRPVRE